MRKILEVSTLAVAALLPLVGCKQEGPPTPTAEASKPAATPAAPAAAAPGIVDQAKSAIASAFGSEFQGAITMHVSEAHGAEDVTFLTKGGKLRVDPPTKNGMSAHVILDPAKDGILVVMDQQKMYMQMPMPSAGGAGASAGAKSAPSGSQVVKSGKHETIAGTDCEDWSVTEASGKHVDVCVAKGLSFFDFSALGPNKSAPSAWIDELRAQHYFPLKVATTDAAGKQTSNMLVTNIEKKPLDDAMFIAPPGYTTMSLPMGMPAMPGMPAMARKMPQH